MVTVMVVVVGVTVEDDRVAFEPLPLAVVTATDTEFAVVLNSKPDGAVRIMVPTDIPAAFVSVITGPVKVVYAPVPPVLAVSAEMALPPVATVTLPVSVKMAWAMRRDVSPAAG